MSTPPRRIAPLALALLLSALFAAAAFAAVTVRADLTDLLPTGQTAAGRMMVQQLRDGAASRLLLAGIEGAPAGALAAVSEATARRLRGSKSFSLVENGGTAIDPAALAELFRYRYLLAPGVTADSFAVPALRHDFQSLLEALASSASPFVQRYGLPDPTGALASMTGTIQGRSDVRAVGGVWFAADRQRALMVLQSAANGLDYTAQDAALQALRDAFDAARASVPGASRATLLVSGPAVFAAGAARTIRADVRLITPVSALLVALLLFWRFRSLWVLGVIAVPLLVCVAAGALAVQLCFGFVHGIALGYGVTMLGVAADYPVLLIGHRKAGEAPPATLRRIGPTFDMAVLTAALGLTGMVFARLPGLSQLGVFAVTGILAAAAVTRFALPRLVAAAQLAPAAAGDPARLMRIERLRRYRLAALAPVAAAAIWLALSGGAAWDGDLAHLSPVPAAALALDAQLRAELGAGEAGDLLMVEAGSADQVLAREEALRPRLRALAQTGAIAGADSAADLLPSLAAQRARQALLPDDATLAPRIAAAAAGMGFTQGAFLPFRADVATARALAPLAPGALPPALAQDRLLTARLDALLFTHGGRWFGIVAPHAVNDAAALAAAFAGMPGVTYVDVHAQTNDLAAGYARQARPWLLAGAAGALLMLAAGLRDATRVLRVLGSIAAALVVTVAALRLGGARLTLVHVMALQFAAGIGLDYALFFSRPGLDVEERSRTLRTLFTCNAMALLTFGLLAACRTPLLRDIGTTVAVGVVCAMLSAFMFAGPLADRRADRDRPA